MYLAEANLARWADALTMSQALNGQALSRQDRALLAYGLEARLKHSALAKAFLQHSANETGVRLADLSVDVIASDPYLRDTFEHVGGMKEEVRAVRVHRIPGAVPGLQRLRENLAANWWLRRMTLRYKSHLRHSDYRLNFSRVSSDKQKTAAFFVLSQRFMDLFQPVLSELEVRGWRVPVFFYNQLVRPPKGAMDFDAMAGNGSLADDEVGMPRWMISEEVVSESLVSRRGIDMALNASWATAKVQTARHRWLLESLRPDVVISYGPDTMSLALQAAAKSLQIPSVFISHGFHAPVPSSWYLGATASTMLGPPCVKALEGKKTGLIATGHPSYDAILKRAENMKGQRRRLLGLNTTGSRPYLVVVFALYAQDLVGYAFQRRALELLTQALPDDVFLVCKLHPTKEEREFCETMLRVGLPSDAFRVVSDTEYSTPDLLEACHVAVMHEQCMTLADTIVMNRPAVAIRFPEFPMGTAWMNHPMWAFRKAWRLVSDAIELREALFLLTRDESARQALLKYRKTFIDRFLMASDGRSTERVTDLVEHLGVGKDPGSFVPVIGTSLVQES